VQLTKRGKWHASGRAEAGGFTLLEVMMAMVITAIGLLGIAKIQALAYSSTSSAGIRSLVAIQAAGLAASMHANRNYWSVASGTITITNTTIAESTNTLNTAATTPTYCNSGVSAPCNPATLAAFDLHTFARALFGMLPNSNPVTTISCPAGNIPVTCTITVTWNEKEVAINAEGTSSTANTFSPSYMLYVEP
jgi:type IV pilus assembly protein PilV